MRQTRKTHLAFFLLTLFMAYQASTTMFTHIHEVNGVRIVHSHPFHHKNHSHTIKSLVIIAYLGAFHTSEAKTSECLLFAKRPVLWILSPEVGTPLLASASVDYISLRAPPYC